MTQEIDVALLNPREMLPSDSMIGLDQNDQTVRVTIDARNQSYDSLTAAVAAITTDPANIERVSTASYRNEAECTTLGISYPDGGGADYVVEDNDGKAIIDGVWPAGSKQLKLIFTLHTNFLHWGAVGDGIFDNRELLRLYFKYSQDTVTTAVIPEGKFRVDKTTGELVRLQDKDFSVKGVSKASILFFDEGVDTGRNDFIRCASDSGNSFDIDVQSITMEGSWEGGASNLTPRSHLLEVQTTGRVAFKGVTFSKSWFMSSVVNESIECTYTDCKVLTGLRDGLRTRNCNSTIFTNNYLFGVLDDSLVCTTTPDAVGKSETNLVATGNVLLMAQGFNFAGANKINVSDNILNYVWTRGIGISLGAGSSPLGPNPLSSIIIKGNIITDVMSQVSFDPLAGGFNAYIHLDTTPLGDLAFSSDGANVVHPDGLFYNIGNTYTESIEKYNIDISNNQLGRTLSQGLAFSTNSVYPLLFTKLGYVDPIIDDNTHLGGSSAMLRLRGAQRSLSIRENLFFGHKGSSVEFDSDGRTEVLNETCSISRCVFDNVGASSGVCIKLEGEGLVDINNNTFNLDPTLSSGGRGATGTWDGVGFAKCIQHSDPTNLSVSFNAVKNASALMTNLEDCADWHSNTFYGIPVSVGFDTANKGVGKFESKNNTRYIVTESDPVSADFGKVLSQMKTKSLSIPSTGVYIEGVEVAKAAVFEQGTAGSKYLVKGWLRTNTGSGHVLNTDWLEMRVLTGN